MSEHPTIPVAVSMRSGHPYFLSWVWFVWWP